MLRGDTFSRRTPAAAMLLIAACGCDLGEEAPRGTSPAHGGAEGAGVDDGSTRVGTRSAATKRSNGGSDSDSADSKDGKKSSRAKVGADGEGDDSGEPEALPWSPEDLAPSAWFVASSGDFQVLSGVAHWFDHRGTQLSHLEQATAWAQPQLDSTGWNGTQPTIKWSGLNLMTRAGWTGSPNGTNAGFTLLAVLRSGAVQNAGIASWWNEYGDGVWANLKSTAGLTQLEFHKLDDGSYTQMHSGGLDLGTSRHVVAWRYSPGLKTFTLTVDGAHSISSPQPPLGLISDMPLIVGATSPLPTGFFTGDISELVFVGRDITDAEVQDFTEYARNAWSGLPAAPGPGVCIKADGQPSPDTIRCDDGNAATVGDHCFLGTCSGSVPRPGSPKELSPSSWYYASEHDVAITQGGVSTWYDRAPARQDLLNGYWFRPALVTNGWNGNRPTLTFNGPGTVKRNNWIGTPTGTEKAFTALAVIRTTSTDAGVAGFWSHNGSRVTLQVKPAGLDLFRMDGWPNASQEFVADVPLGTTRHAVAWRYGDGLMKLSVDGFTRTQAKPAINDITPEIFLVGMAHIFGGHYGGDISELAIIPRSITDTELERFNDYAQAEWGGLTLCTPDCIGKNVGDDNECGGICGCSQTAPLEAPVAAFTGSMDADGLTFSADGLTAYISGAGPGNRDIYVVTRSSSEGTFGTPELVTQVNTGGFERAPSLSPDGRLYFTKQPAAMFDIGRAVGTAPSFTGAEVVPAPISSSQQDEDPFWWGNNTLLYVSEVDNGGAHRDIWTATWTGTSFLTPTKLQGQDLHSGYEELRPVLSPDGLTLYYGSRRGGIGSDFDGDVWMAKRTSTTASFGPSVNLAGLNSSGVDYPVTVSADGCTLYFASNEETGFGGTPIMRLYKTTRGTSTPLHVTLRLNILGQGSVNSGPFACGPGNTGVCSATAPPDTTMVILASGQAQWTGSCSANGAGQPSTDGVLTFSPNAVCTIKFPGGAPNGEGGLCALPMDCQPGLTCVNNTCTSCVPGVCNAQCPCGTGGSCDDDSDCQSGIECTNGTCGCPQGASCDDGSVCTQSDTCDAGVCVGGPPVATDDMNSCTADACHPVTGVSHTPMPENTSCTLPDGAISFCDGAGTCEPRTLGDCIATGARDSTEECDDNVGSEADLCSAECRVTDALAVRGAAAGESRYLGESRHPVAAGPRGFGVTFVEPDGEPPVIGLSVFDSAGDPRGRLSVSSGSLPVLFASPAAAALDDGSYAVVWTDFGQDGDELGVALRRVIPAAPGSTPPVSGAELGSTLAPLQFANGTTDFSQYDADILRVGNELIVAWTDTSNASTAPDIRYRAFQVGTAGATTRFRAVAAEQTLSASSEFEGNVALAPFAGSWAAAWRASYLEAEETIEVAIPSTGMRWSIGPHLAGAPEDRPAVAELDAEHLAVLFSVSADNESADGSRPTRLRLAVLALGDPEPVSVVDFVPDDEDYGDPSISQSHPSFVRAGSALYAAWRTASLFANPEAENVFLRELGWTTEILAAPEYRIPRATIGSRGDQRFPALGVGPQQIGTPGLPNPAPQGSLVVAWDDYGRQFGSVEGQPDVLVQFWPLPMLRVGELASSELMAPFDPDPGVCAADPNALACFAEVP